MRLRSGFLAALPAVLMLPAVLPGCDSRTPAVRSSDSQSVAGLYEVVGTTTVVESGASRPISGAVILVQEGDRYSATFDLRTTYPGPDGNLEAEVIGTGEGEIRDSELRGSAETQIMTAAFPGVDPKFPFLARQYGPRVVSKSVATVKPGGEIVLEIENQGAEGATYLATQTVMTGSRAKRRGVDGFPAVGADRVRP